MKFCFIMLIKFQLRKIITNLFTTFSSSYCVAFEKRQKLNYFILKTSWDKKQYHLKKKSHFWKERSITLNYSNNWSYSILLEKAHSVFVRTEILLKVPHYDDVTVNLFSCEPRYISLGIKFKEVGNAITIIMHFNTVIVSIHLYYFNQKSQFDPLRLEGNE